MSDVLIWYGLSWLLGLLALPYSFLVFRRLPDRGYAFTKPLGLLLVGLLAWWLGNLKLLPFNQLTSWIAILGVGLGGNLLILANSRLGRDLWEWFGQRHNLKLVAGAEAVFLAAYAFMINTRSFFPELDKSEKFFDLAFINAIAASPTLPPPDPWFYGEPMNYYYGGQLLMGVLVKLTGTPYSTAYNIAMGLVYAMGVIACYGLASNLIGLARGKQDNNKQVIAPIWAGFVGAAFLMILGNLATLRQVLRDGLLPTQDRNFPFWVEWGASARMVYDPMPDGRLLDILTEYPIYSYLNGDLHAHLLGAPYVILALGFVLNLYATPQAWALGAPHWRSIPRFLVAGMLLGALYFINGGDFPIYMALAIAVLGVAEWRAGGGWWRVVLRWGVQTAALGAALWLVYFFYLTSFTGMIRARPDLTYGDTPIIGFMSRFVGWIAWPRTNLMEYLLMFGLFLLPVVTFMSLKLAQLAQEEVAGNVKFLPRLAQWGVFSAGVVFASVGVVGLFRVVGEAQEAKLTLASAVVMFVGFSGAAWTLWPKAWQALRQRPQLAIEAMVLLVLVLLGPLVWFELLGPISALTYFALRLAWREWRNAPDPAKMGWLFRLDILALGLIALAGGLTLFCELFYVKDIYANRFNTMFKFWYSLWVLWGFAGVYSLWRVYTWGNQAQGMQPTTDEDSSRLVPTSRDAKPGWQVAGFRPLLQLLRPRTRLASGNLSFAIDDLRLKDSSVSAPSSPSSLIPHPSSLPAPEQAPGKVLAGWRWAWTVVLAFLILWSTAVPTLAYYQATNKYTGRMGLDGEQWYSRAFPSEYRAMTWLRDYTAKNPARRGVVLEANGMNYSWANRISTFTGLPTVIGWPFHELQWRGNLDEKAIWEPWLDMSRIYETTDVERAKELLKQHRVRYVFIGQVENGTRSLRSDGGDMKNYPPEGLAKFAKFMKAIYADPDNNIYIYAFE